MKPIILSPAQRVEKLAQIGGALFLLQWLKNVKDQPPDALTDKLIDKIVGKST